MNIFANEILCGLNQDTICQNLTGTMLFTAENTTEATSALQAGDNYPVVALVPWEMLFTLCNFVILLLILKKFLLKPIQKILDKRANLIVKDLNDAKVANEQAQIKNQEYDQKLLGAKEEARELIASAQKAADKSADAIIGEANTKAAAAIARGEKEILRQKEKATAEVKGEIGSMATLVAEKILKKEISLQDNEDLIQETIKNL